MAIKSENLFFLIGMVLLFVAIAMFFYNGFNVWIFILGFFVIILLVPGWPLQGKNEAFFMSGMLLLYALAGYKYFGGSENVSFRLQTVWFILALTLLTLGIITITKRTLEKKRRYHQILSLIIFNLGAIGIFAKHLIAPGLHCYACPWATAGCPIGLLQNWIMLGEIPYYLLGSLFAVFALVGRAFCGWACPFGFLHDIIHMLPGRKADVRFNRTSYITRTIVFALMIFFAWDFSWKAGTTLFCKVCPAGFIEAAVPFRVVHGVPPDPLFVARIVIFMGLVMIVLVISRFWCRFLCPLGHLAGHFNSLSFVKLQIDKKSCNMCGRCEKVCPMGVNPVKGNNTNCILCGKCVDNCPTNAITISTPQKYPFSSLWKAMFGFIRKRTGGTVPKKILKDKRLPQRVAIDTFPSVFIEKEFVAHGPSYVSYKSSAAPIEKEIKEKIEEIKTPKTVTKKFRMILENTNNFKKHLRKYSKLWNVKVEYETENGYELYDYPKWAKSIVIIIEGEKKNVEKIEDMFYKNKLPLCHIFHIKEI
ncbi:MAG: 4Fe-4S binding protein [Candidatus Methanofastidiosia archaeon]